MFREFLSGVHPPPPYVMIAVTAVFVLACVALGAVLGILCWVLVHQLA